MTFLICLLLAVSKDNLGIVNIGEGDKLVLVADLFIPANTTQLRFYQGHTVCCFDIVPTNRDRKIEANTELIFSGINSKYEALVKSTPAIAGVVCFNYSIGYTPDANFLYNRNLKTYKDELKWLDVSARPATISQLKSVLRNAATFVPSKPQIIK